jgi:DNA polymerase-3 subunit beta
MGSIILDEMSTALSCADVLVDKNPHYPIYGKILFHKDSDRLMVTATDGNITIIYKLDYIGHDEADHAVDFSKFYGAVKASKKCHSVDLNFSKNTVSMSGESFRYSFPSVPGREYPEYIRRTPSDVSSIAKAGNLIDMLSMVSYCSASGDLRHFLNGLNISIDGRMISATATDSHRLAHYRCDTQHESLCSGSAIIPNKAVKAIQRALGSCDSDCDVNIYIYENGIVFSCENWTIDSSVISGKYPDCSKLISLDYPNKILVNSGTFKNDIKKASVLGESRINISIDCDKVRISTSMGEDSSFYSSFNIIDGSGKEIIATYNPSYIKDSLDVVTGPNINIEYSDEPESNPLLFKDALRPQWMSIVMPVRN